MRAFRARRNLSGGRPSGRAQRHEQTHEQFVPKGKFEMKDLSISTRGDLPDPGNARTPSPAPQEDPSGQAVGQACLRDLK